MKARIPGGQGGGQMAMMKRIQEMQAQMEQKQAEIENTAFTASAGGGAVDVTVRQPTKPCARRTTRWNRRWARLKAA